MDRYEEAYESIGLTEEKRRELVALRILCEAVAVESRAVLIETVVDSGHTHEVAHSEISDAKLVRVIR